MKRNKNTIFDVYRYLNNPDYQVLKHTGTILIQSFNHLNTDFEIRLNKDRTRGFVCIDGFVFESFTSVQKVENELKKSELWYLQLNWSDAPEFIENELPKRNEFLKNLTK